MDSQQDMVLRLHGELDDDGCAAVRRQLAPMVANGLRMLVLDLSEVDDIALPGVQMLRSLDRYLRSREGALLLVHPTEPVRSTLNVNELDGLLQVRGIEPSRMHRVTARKPQQGLAGVVPLVRRA